ncbi:protein phosphatase methylesterase 1 [Coprinopsis cinerea okayama7|uniref:Protein phosphatase methylesterase 1 n=1 Tax=Coprinopsis cinerea (strain Okayama-7 / 130 / ATCC MYA-4618 / FGSC 9003) TaxID=240176 RepID=A8NVB5_COPC7|nr:protein phosphatase methylesterase 1 [Coprinopsis cinerea okayama7\|eukprot:XP_001836646.2 protein phosphatase methylesterase 1 [Coprinopsis cinerea okayama7\
MSLMKSAMQARLAKLPHPDQLPRIQQPATMAPWALSENDSDEDEVDEEEEELDSLGDLPPGGGMGPPAMQGKKKEPNPDYAPISAAGYFAEALQVAVPERGLEFRVYHTPSRELATASSSSASSSSAPGPSSASPLGSTSSKGTLMVCHHGAGYSGLSFACFAKEVDELSRGELGVLAIDARRHGKTKPLSDDSEEDQDLSIGVLVDDFVALLKTMFPDPSSAPTFLLVGHSMGGSVVVQACPILQSTTSSTSPSSNSNLNSSSSNKTTSGYRIAGVAVLDVVEGSAIEALPHMHSLLNARPDGFDSVEEGVEWHLTTNTIRNPTSARVSIPAILKHIPDAKVMPEWQWRTTLRSTAPYWSGWFTSLSSKFLATRTARILILAGTDRLDKELMIGQMMGKFQQVVVPGVGHMLHEDDPTRIAEILVEFWRRNERVVVGFKKVGER